MASVLVFACTREAVCDGTVTDYPSLFNDRVEITFPNAPGSNNPLKEFPFLIRLSENSPEGFSYARVDPLGQDIRFVFVEGSTSTAVPYEVDTWNTNGVSSLWVRLPKYSDKADLKLIMYWAPDDATALPTNLPRTVWNGYTAVWHMNGTAESTTNAIAGTSGEKAEDQTGLVGAARGTRYSGNNGPILQVAGGTPLDAITNDAYTITGWLKVNLFAGGGEVWLYSAREKGSDSAFGLSLLDSTSLATLHPKQWCDATTSFEWSNAQLPKSEWVHFAATHVGAEGRHRLYLNGVEIDENSKRLPTNDVTLAKGFSLGGLAGTAGTLNGDLDEVRVYPGELKKNWLTNEYAQALCPTDRVAFTNFVTTGKEVYVKTQEKEPTGGDDPVPQAEEDVSTADYAGTAVIVPDALADGVVLTNFVMLVKVWDGEPQGFSPQALPFGSEDIRFFDELGNVLPFEIDTWDPNDISTFWLKVPYLKKSSQITMCWGLKEGKTLPTVDPTEVWSDYAGVWHMTDENDSTANRATGTFGSAATLKYGLIGKAAGTSVSGQKGAILDIESNTAIDALADGPFTVSGWMYLNKAALNYGALFSRATADDPAWGARFAGGTSGDSSALAVETGSSGWTNEVEISVGSWVRFDFVYATNRLAIYLDGELKGESAQERTILSGTSGGLSIGGLVAAAEGTLGAGTFNGAIDEFRLKAGVEAENVRKVESDQGQYDDFYTRQPASWDDTATLQNRWRTEPKASKTEWNEGDTPATFTLGEPWYGTSVLGYQVRSTGEILGGMPTEAGDYRAVFYVAAEGRYSSLTYTIDFRIRMYRPTHDLGTANDRILLLNNDQSVSDGKVYVQCYSDSAAGIGRPYWVHDVDSGYDYTSTSAYYNFCGGLRHTYWSADGETRLWDLLDVRYGNTYNNADAVLEETGDWEEGEEGLKEDMNYLSWNPEGGCLIDAGGLTAEGWHEYAAQAVLCNTLGASVNSTLYTNGIGTIYFDCVNSHTDDATNGCYRLVVEMATNSVERNQFGEIVSRGLPTDEAIASYVDGQYDAEGNPVVADPYYNAEWKPLTMNVKLVNGETMTDLEPTNELTLALAGGGSYTNFYRVYVPIDYFGLARFRIRRTAINTDYTMVSDVHSMILVDNVICSYPCNRAQITPRGFYDETKVMRETAGYEGAFKPSYPSVSDAEVYARVRATTLLGQPISAGSLSSVAMHYRWRYLDQQSTSWQILDIDPTTLTSFQPISWPGVSGDLEYWYEAGQSSEFYQYADYSGRGLGLPGYSEEVASVTNRASTYETYGRDWFTRIRDGKSTYGEIKIFVRRGSLTASEEVVDMFVTRDQIWRGCLQTTNAVAGGIYFRFEGRNCQDDSLADFQFNTNRWYLADDVEAMPVSGSVVAGTTNDWCQIPCDAVTGYLMFQLDEQTRALTVVHADWQDFNGWNDAAKSYFSGSSTDDSTKRGVSSQQREYACLCSQWTDDQATNDAFWAESFTPSSYSGYRFYWPFLSEQSPNGFGVGEGMWVRGAYADTSDLSGMAVQMAGQGRGYVQLVDPTVEPRGIEAVKFSARVAQAISPDDFAYYDGSPTESASFLNDYTFMARVAFDRNGNSNFTGNASLSLAAFYRQNVGCYEARWEQLDGDLETGSGRIFGPASRGQRLAIYRWDYQERDWVATELFAATNSAKTGCNWNPNVAPRAIPATHSITNGLMPFFIGAYNNGDADPSKNETLVIAAVYIPGGTSEAENIKGVYASAEISTMMTTSAKGWFYVVYRDKLTSAGRKPLTRGSYGVLSANCEGIFVRPQIYPKVVSWDTEANTKTKTTQIYPSGSTASATVKFETPVKLHDCVNEFQQGYWIVPDGRMVQFGDGVEYFNGFGAAEVSQTVDIYTAPIGTTSWSETPVAQCEVKGFGAPGYLQNAGTNLWITDDSSVRIQAGGTIRNVRTDVVVDNIRISQWRGQDWLGNNATERAAGGLTNFVYTSGWITDGALQLSPRRTPDNTPCSLRVPLCDGGRSGKVTRGLGLGSFWIRCRNVQTNANLLVQIATNGVSTLNIRDLTLSPWSDSRWTTITNWNYEALTEEGKGGVVSCDNLLGLHGVVGTLRVIVSNDWTAVHAATDPTAFGSVDIVEAYFRDEPPLDKGSWWGFNIRTIGDVSDIEQRMYLPDNPLRTLPTLDQYGRSFALNNSITEDCDPAEVAKGTNPFRNHMPFLQTPTFTSNIVGEVSFKARKWTLQKGAQCAEVALYGTRSLKVDDVKDKEWDLLNIFVISNTTYETYRFKTDTSNPYRAFRFAVTGVDGVLYPGPEPTQGDEPVRVLLDDVLVSEAIRARLAFRNVGAFRHSLSGTAYVPNVPSTTEQPIVGEGWGVQAEIYPAMLGEEIDTTTKPRVRLHYYKGLSPWGFWQWQSKGTSAWLTRASDTNNFYRSSSSDSPAAVIPMANSGEIVQYMLEVVYTVVNSETGGRSIATNWLESSDWKVPSWYYPVDYNATQGGNESSRFAAFSILDKIAPGWAWINEINIFGQFNSSYRNSDTKKQFVEVVKPVDYDLDGWSLRMLAAKSYGGTQTAFLTNTVAVFGRNNVPKQKEGGASCSHMSFLVVGNPSTTLSGTQYDGAWSFPTTDNRVFEAGNVLGSYYPLAIQLVRPSGVIEHEVAILGTNAYESVATSIAWQYSSTNLVRQLKANDADSTVFALPDDRISSATSVGITGEDSAREKTALCWNNTMGMTPGDLNEGQKISADYPRPGGELIMVFAYVDSAFGRITQTVGSGTNTTEMQTITLTSGSEEGLDIKYTVDPWCELGEVKETENGQKRTPVITETTKRHYTVNVGKGATKNVTVIASATVDSELRTKYGLTADNRYTPAVLHWLETGKTCYSDFYDTESCEIKLAKFMALSGSVITNMTLTQMYWLDMDPTAGEMYFRAGMVRPPAQVVLDEPTFDPQHDPQAITNLRLGVYMSISNGNGHASVNDKSVWAPYVLRGLGNDELSWNYSTSGNASGAWTSETFKVTGFLNSGLKSTDNVEAWIPLRYFVFWQNSFDSNFEAEIDVADPFSSKSPASTEGWSRYVEEHGGVKPSVYLSWNIDERLKPITAEILAPTNRLDGTGTP